MPMLATAVVYLSKSILFILIRHFLFLRRLAYSLPGCYNDFADQHFYPLTFHWSMPPPPMGVAFYVSKKVLSVIIYLRCTRLSQGAIYQLLWIMKSPVIRYTRPPSEDVPSGSTPPCT